MTAGKLTETADANKLHGLSSLFMTVIILSKEVNYYVISILEKILSKKYQNQEKGRFSSSPPFIKYVSFTQTHHFTKNNPGSRFKIAYRSR